MRIGHQKIFQLSRYLPEGSEIIQLGTYKDQVAVAAEQTQEGIETAILYVYNKENYICGVREQQAKGMGNVIYIEKLPFERVNYFKWVHLDSKVGYQLLIGGKRKEDMSKSELIAYQISAEGVKKIPHEPIYFDEIELQKVDDKVQIVVWQNKVLEVYDILVYRLQDGEIVSGGWDESKYLNKVISYYKYLVQIYPGEAIYKRYLRELTEKREQLFTNAEIGQSIERKTSMDLGNKEQIEIENAEGIAVEQREEAEKDVEPLEEEKKIGDEQGKQEEATDSVEGEQQVIVEDTEFKYVKVLDGIEGKQQVVGNNIDISQESMVGSMASQDVEVVDNAKIHQEVVVDNTEAKQETMAHSTEVRCTEAMDYVEPEQEMAQEYIGVREEVSEDGIESKRVEEVDDAKVQQNIMLDNTELENPIGVDDPKLQQKVLIDNTDNSKESMTGNTNPKQSTCRGCEQYKMRCRWRKVCRRIN